MPLEKQPYLAIVAPIKNWLAPFCSLRDSASDDISVITLKNGFLNSEDQSCFSMKQRTPVHRFVTRDFFSISYKSMDAYRGIFILCTINGPCAWYQAIAGPLNNKNLKAKLICDFSVRILFFMQFLWV